MPFSEFIENLDLDCANYRSGTIPIIQCGNRIGNDIFYKSFRGRADVKISFSSGVGSRVYIGSEFEGSLNLQISASNCLVYIGNFSRLNDVTIKIRSDMGRVFVGNGVTTSGKNLWLNGSSVGFPKDIVIGDDCMFSWGVTIRNTDGHPIYDVKSWEVLNSASSPLIIEPALLDRSECYDTEKCYCWSLFNCGAWSRSYEVGRTLFFRFRGAISSAID